jgi:DNA transformation protein and related proteins
MAVQAQYLAYVLEQLAGLERVSKRRMFGAVGLYCGELFFGLIDDDTLFFKTGESNSAEYQARKMPRFMPPANRPLGPMGYHQVPADIIEDGEALVAWARKAVAVALVARAKPRTAKRKPAKKKPPEKKKTVVRPAKPRRQR